ncbi:hypothetical protein [Nonomuraea fuscirosea]|uniref:hypothetical protein n=1 Tax=Nonomuraea fuscirosea TaxID=1291556 RepID=UPI0015E6CD9C|nr:hypothetical protein [Nonomuraea fuscirosea]
MTVPVDERERGRRPGQAAAIPPIRAVARLRGRQYAGGSAGAAPATTRTESS